MLQLLFCVRRWIVKHTARGLKIEYLIENMWEILAAVGPDRYGFTIVVVSLQCAILVSFHSEISQLVGTDLQSVGITNDCKVNVNGKVILLYRDVQRERCHGDAVDEVAVLQLFQFRFTEYQVYSYHY